MNLFTDFFEVFYDWNCVYPKKKKQQQQQQQQKLGMWPTMKSNTLHFRTEAGL